MKKSIFTIAFFSCFCTSLIKAQIPTTVSNRLQTVLDSVCNKYHIKGTSAAVLIPDVGIWKGVNGISQEGVPLTTDMLFGMGSNTKTHIAATLLKMQEQHLLSLDDTIGKWIQGYPNINGQITIRQCLGHTSGLFDYMHNAAVNDSIFNNESKIWKREDILWLAEAPNFAPGTDWDYSNTNYIIAGIIIEKVMNQSPYKVIHDLILAPNQLSNTFNFGEQGSIVYAHPWSMNMNGTTLTDMTTSPYLSNLFSLANTAGSLITTAEDNVLFWHKLFSGQIINAQSWKEMTTIKNLGSGTRYGLGIFRYSRKINVRTAYSHGGTFFGYINENMVDTTSGVTVAALTNQDSVNNGGILALVIASLHKVTLQAGYTAVENITDNTTNIKLYPNPANNTITIQTDNTDLVFYLFDITGKQQLSEPIINNESTLNVEHLQPGFYFASLRTANGQIIRTQKIQIVR